MRVAVTGATGFVGGAIARRLAASGHEVLALGRRPGPVGDGLVAQAWDLANLDPPPAELARCDAVVHAAARVNPWGPDQPFQAATVSGTRRLLGEIDPAARLVVIGSASVYDPRVAHMAVHEDAAPVAPTRYLNGYGRAKATQERFVRLLRPDAVVLRPRAIWGPGDRTLIPRLLARIHAGRLVLPDGGRHPMSTTHVSTLVTAVEAALASPQVSGPVNVADATPTTGAALIDDLSTALGRPIRIVAVPARLADVVARAVEAAWRLDPFGHEPPFTRYAVAAFARAFTLDLGRLHRELGVRPDVGVSGAARELAVWLGRAG